MGLGLVAVVVSTPFERFKVRVERGARPPQDEQLRSVLRAAGDLRFGLEMRDPEILRAARELVRLLDGGGFGFGRDLTLLDDAVDGFGRTGRFANSELRDISRRLEEALLAGRLVIEREQIAPLSDRREPLELQLPPLPPVRRDSGTLTFEVRFIDEAGKAISGIDAEFTADGAQTRVTNAAGVALLEGVRASSATVSILDPDALSTVLDARWERRRPGAPPKESNTSHVVFRREKVGPFALKAELPNTVVIEPPLAKLSVELFDKTGRVRHANRPFVISGPETIEGTTDESGFIERDEVMQGDYRLSLTIESFKGDPDETLEVVEAPLITVDPVVGQPQVRMIGAVPISILARLHLFFNTNKAFLLPTALASMQKLRRLYIENAPCKLLVVGHADTKGGAPFNDELSLARARATIAYLKDDVDAWLEFYKLNDPKQVWGKVEDHLMLIAMPDFSSKPRTESEVAWFQRTRGLSIDCEAGKQTRTALIGEYMSLDGASLTDFVGEVDAVAHGCGENFPLDDGEEELDAAPQDEKR